MPGKEPKRVAMVRFVHLQMKDGMDNKQQERLSIWGMEYNIIGLDLVPMITQKSQGLPSTEYQVAKKEIQQ